MYAVSGPFFVILKCHTVFFQIFFCNVQCAANPSIVASRKVVLPRATACSDGGFSNSESSLSLPLSMETLWLSACSYECRYCSHMRTRISKSLRLLSNSMFPNVNTLNRVVLPHRHERKNILSFWMSWLVYQQNRDVGASHDKGAYEKKKSNRNLSSAQQRWLVAAGFYFMKR